MPHAACENATSDRSHYGIVKGSPHRTMLSFHEVTFDLPIIDRRIATVVPTQLCRFCRLVQQVLSPVVLIRDNLNCHALCAGLPTPHHFCAVRGSPDPAPLRPQVSSAPAAPHGTHESQSYAATYEQWWETYGRLIRRGQETCAERCRARPQYQIRHSIIHSESIPPIVSTWPMRSGRTNFRSPATVFLSSNMQFRMSSVR